MADFHEALGEEKVESSMGEQTDGPEGVPVEASEADESVPRPEYTSRYATVVLAAKRAKQLKDAKVYAGNPGTNVLTAALDEVREDKIYYRLAAEEAKPIDD